MRARGKKEEEKAREEATLDPQVLELRRKRSNWRTKKKIKLLEKFPSYIQVWKCICSWLYYNRVYVNYNILGKNINYILFFVEIWINFSLMFALHQKAVL